MKTATQLRILPFSLIVFVLTSCDNPGKDFKKAEQANTEQAYQEFIQKHPDSPLVAQAQSDLEKVAYAAVKRDGRASALENFLNRFPKSPLLKEAQGDLETVEYEQTKQLGSVDNYGTFLARFPNGTHATAASNDLARLVFQQVVATNTAAAYQSFVTRFPRGEMVPDAMKRIEALDYQAATNANDISSCREFLRKYQSGDEVEDIKARLASQLEEQDWNHALLENNKAAYRSFYTAHPTTKRARVLSGTLTGVISFVREDGVLLIPGQGDPDVVITADRGDHGPIKIPMSQAIDLGILSTVNGRISFSSSDKYVFPGGELVVAPQPSSDERTGRGYKVLLFSGGSGQ